MEMDRKRTRHRTLDLQLEAIADTLAMAQYESSLERRAQLLLVVERAFAAYHKDHQAAVQERPHLRLLQGGAGVSALAPMVWWREMQGERTTVAIGAITAAVGAGALVFAVYSGGGGGGPHPPQAAATVTVSQTIGTSQPEEPPGPAGIGLAPAPDPSASGTPTPPAHSEAAAPPPRSPAPRHPRSRHPPGPRFPGRLRPLNSLRGTTRARTARSRPSPSSRTATVCWTSSCRSSASASRLCSACDCGSPPVRTAALTW